MIEDISPPEAWAMLNENEDAVLVDVRAKVEHDFVGWPPGAVLVSWQDPPGAPAAPDFVDKVVVALKQCRADRDPARNLTVLTLCRSGARSRAAGEALLARGFRNVFNVAEGFEGDRDENGHRGNINGWRYYGLPWEQT